MTKFRKGQFVTYALPHSADRVEAVVHRAHRDGSVTVEARFVLDPDGNPRRGYLGYRYRYDASDLQPVA